MSTQPNDLTLPSASVLIEPWEMSSLEKSAELGDRYALLDACNEPAVEGMAGIHPGVDCLFQGQAAEDFSAIAPYLFDLDSPLLDWFKDQLMEKPCGIFIDAPVDRANLRAHLRRLLKVEVPNDRQFYFRFYDPRVLPGFLATAPPTVVAQFFGPIRACFYFEQSQLYRISPKPTVASSASPTQTSWPVGYRLSVSQDHLQAMDRFSKQKFAQRLERHLDEVLSSQNLELPKLGVEKRVSIGIHNAENYCLHTEQHIATYVELMCVGFPMHDQKNDPEEVRRLMFDRRLSIDDRLHRLRTMVTV